MNKSIPFLIIQDKMSACGIAENGTKMIRRRVVPISLGNLVCNFLRKVGWGKKTHGNTRFQTKKKTHKITEKHFQIMKSPYIQV